MQTYVTISNNQTNIHIWSFTAKSVESWPNNIKTWNKRKLKKIKIWVHTTAREILMKVYIQNVTKPKFSKNIQAIKELKKSSNSQLKSIFCLSDAFIETHDAFIQISVLNAVICWINSARKVKARNMLNFIDRHCSRSNNYKLLRKKKILFFFWKKKRKEESEWASEQIASFGCFAWREPNIFVKKTKLKQCVSWLSTLSPIHEW